MMQDLLMRIEQEKPAMQNKFDTIAVACVSADGYKTALRICSSIPATLFVPSDIEIADGKIELCEVRLFENGIHVLTEDIFPLYQGIVYVMPSGIVVRTIAPFIQNKYSDPAIVTVDVCGRWAIATLSGHEGGANVLAEIVARTLRSEPIVTTSSDSLKTIIAGIGCRKGVSSEDVHGALHKALDKSEYSLKDIRQIVTIDIKEHEKGLLDFCNKNSIPLRILSREQIGEARINCEESEFVNQTIGIGAVAVPCALLGGTKTALITERIAWNNVTVALARENCTW